MTDELYSKARLLREARNQIEFTLAEFGTIELGKLIALYLPEKEQNEIREDIRKRLIEKLNDVKEEFEKL